MNGGDEMVRGLGDVLDLHRYLGENGAGDIGCCGCAWHGPHARHYTAEQRRGFHRAHVADILAAHVLGLVTAGKAEAVQSLADWFRDTSHETFDRRWLVALLDMRVESHRADGLAGEAS